MTRQTRQLNWGIYLARSLFALGVVTGIFIFLLARIIKNHVDPIFMVTTLDIFHNLFYGFIALYVFYILIGFFRAPITGGYRAIYALALGTLAGLFPLYAILKTRPDFQFTHGMVALVAMLMINMALGFWMRSKPNETSRLSTVLRRGFPVTDLLLPEPVRRAYFTGNKVLGGFGVIFPLLLIAIPFSLLTLIAASDYSHPDVHAPRYHPCFQKVLGDSMGREAPMMTPVFTKPIKDSLPDKIFGPEFFGMRLSENDDVLWVSQINILSRIQLKPTRLLRMSFLQTQPGAGVLDFSLLPGENRIVAVMFSKGILEVLNFNATDLTLSDETQFKMDFGDLEEKSQTLWDSQREIQVGVTEKGLARFSADGKTITRVNLCQKISWAILDPKRRLIYTTFFLPGKLTAFDVDTLEQKQTLALPPLAQRIAIDPVSDRLFISYPAEGLIRVVDLESFTVKRTIKTAFGVRALWVDSNRRLLFTAGFSPYMEIFDLDNLTLATRLKAPFWSRNILTAKKDNFGFVSSMYGLYQIDLEKVEMKIQGPHWEKADLFFDLFHLANRLIHLLPIHLIEYETSSGGSLPPLCKPVQLPGGKIESLNQIDGVLP